jgi:hypothetical protein
LEPFGVRAVLVGGGDVAGQRDDVAGRRGRDAALAARVADRGDGVADRDLWFGPRLRSP